MSVTDTKPNNTGVERPFTQLWHDYGSTLGLGLIEAVVLSECVRWTNHYLENPKRRGWFYRTENDWKAISPTLTRAALAGRNRNPLSKHDRGNRARTLGAFDRIEAAFTSVVPGDHRLIDRRLHRPNDFIERLKPGKREYIRVDLHLLEIWMSAAVGSDQSQNAISATGMNTISATGSIPEPLINATGMNVNVPLACTLKQRNNRESVRTEKSIRDGALQAPYRHSASTDTERDSPTPITEIGFQESEPIGNTTQTLSPHSPPSPQEQWERRTWAMVDAFHSEAGYEREDVSARDRHVVFEIFRDYSDRYDANDVTDCTAYFMSDPYWQESATITAKKVAETLAAWRSAGRPDKMKRESTDKDKSVEAVFRVVS